MIRKRTVDGANAGFWGTLMQDVWTLFMIMDNDQTGLVNLEEFVSGGRMHVSVL